MCGFFDVSYPAKQVKARRLLIGLLSYGLFCTLPVERRSNCPRRDDISTYLTAWYSNSNRV